jgi:hypothetical protein
MRPFTMDSDYVNPIGLETDKGSERIKAAYGANYERLVAVKNKYDPTNLFRHGFGPRFGVGPFGRTRTPVSRRRMNSKAQERAEPEVRIHLPPPASQQ